MIAVFVDWGSTNFRAYLVELHSQLCVMDSVASAEGILTIKDGDFAGVLQRALVPWKLPAGTLVLLCGMAGSRHGWSETQYLPTPVGIHHLSGALVALNNQFGWRIELIPGVSSNGVDVMRGEEIQALGSYIDCGHLCLPGTHSKWLTMRQGQIESFKTFMTGELYAMLTSQSSLQGVTTELGFEPQAFNDGLSKEGHLSSELFSIRAKVLTGHMDVADGASFLSGLLIGQEFHYLSQQDYRSESIYLVADGVLLSRYQQACEYFDLDYQLIDSQQCFINGMHQLLLARGSQNDS